MFLYDDRVRASRVHGPPVVVWKTSDLLDLGHPRFIFPILGFDMVDLRPFRYFIRAKWPPHLHSSISACVSHPGHSSDSWTLPFHSATEILYYNRMNHWRVACPTHPHTSRTPFFNCPNKEAHIIQFYQPSCDLPLRYKHTTATLS